MNALPGGKRALFAAYHIGGCSSCAYSDDESLAELCQRNEIDCDEVMQVLLESDRNDREMLVSPQQAKALIESGAALYDIRTREEFDAVKIAGAEFLDQFTEQSLMAQADREQTVLICDHRGQHVLDKVAWLRGHDMKNCFGITGGIDAWSQEVDSKLPRYSLEFE